ncbi:MAG: hypothetical protein ABFC62_04075 [Clostridiaceae bacterium]|nr:hypothetical protein [Eubacteriales bacterium]
MFGSKTKQLEEMSAELAQLKARGEEMEKKLLEYHAKEEAIIGALTEAKSAAARIITAAERMRSDMLDEAEQNKRLAAEEAERTVAEAIARAEAVSLDARQKADELLIGVENEAQMYRETLAAFNEQLFAAADHVKTYAEKFEALARGEAIEDDSAEIDYGTAALRRSMEQPAAELPEDYANPAELMRGIYALQGRELPTVEIGVSEAEEEPAAAEEEAAFSGPETGEAEGEGEEEAEHVWTVDEIISDALAKAESEIAVDDQLNALIDDVLKG